MRRVCKLAFVVFFLCFTLISAGCSIISQEQCQQGDWHYIGYADGERGLNPDARLQQISSECSNFGIEPDADLFQDGHRLGLKRYCLASNGYLIGEKGGAIFDQCPEDLRPAFITAYISGLTLKMHQLTLRVEGLKNNFLAAEMAYKNALSHSGPDDELLEQARDRLRYSSWWLEYHKYLLQDTQNKIIRWSAE